MNSTLQTLLKVAGLLLLVTFSAQANTDKYRLILRDDPATTATIGWNQISGSSPVVYYGTTDQGTNWSAYPMSKSVDRSVSDRGMSNHFARLTGLQPNTAYYFVIKDSEGTSQRFWFKTAPNSSDARFSFIAGGDSRNNRTPRQNANRLVAKLRPHAVLFGGDMTDSGTNTQWQNWFDDWQLTTGTDGRMIQIVATRGNHEGNNSILVNLFDVPSSEVYYALTFGGNLIRTYTLNTEISISGNQTTWLQNDLQANNNVVWKMAQYHKPMRPHVSGKSEGNNQYNYWAQLFYDYKVKMVVECDAHTVKTTWPVRPSTGSGSDEGFIRDDETGSVYVGEGCWGAPLRTNDDSKNWTRNTGVFNQFKWIFVDKARIEARTIRVDNATSVGQVSDNDIFTAPVNLDIWNPSNGAVVTIENDNVSVPEVSLTAPIDGAYYDTPQAITLSANASDTDGSISKVEFVVNGQVIATDTSAPYAVSYSIPADGVYSVTAKATDNDGYSSTSSVATFNVGVIQEHISIRINSGNDDVEENTDGSMYMNSSDIELVSDGSRGNQVIGLRFTGLAIPQGAVINTANIQFTVDETANESGTKYIYAHDTDNASAFTTSASNVSSRSKTTASVSWSPATWSSVGASGADQRTPDLKGVVQEVVNRSGWNAGNAMAFVIEGSGKRTAEAYEGSSSLAALLNVTYTVGEGVSTYTLSTGASNGSIGRSPDQSTYESGTSVMLTAIPNSGYEFAGWSGDNSGIANPLTVVMNGNKNITASFTPISTGGEEFTVSSKVSTGNDDAEEAESGKMYLTSSDLELVYDSYQSAGNQQVGMRFTNIEVPQGAVITNAYIQFTVDETKNDSGTLNVYGQDVDNAATFTSSNNNISSRSKTTASVSWSPATWSSVGASGTAQHTPDLKNIVQEIVNRSGWQQGSAMVMIVIGNGRRIAESYNGSSNAAPELYITYQSASGARVAATSSSLLEVVAPRVYPVPFDNTLNFEVSLATDGNIQVTFRNANGQVLATRSVYGIKVGKQVVAVDTADLPAGFYLCELTGIGINESFRVIKK
ncbi:Ig-like domain-containing protein [Limibacter armeniacum]|uniref:Ig-like domain-containing protein n=1 Tax=Limibacter armeniacum TaxID=466084 RepID=UPI002FE5EF6B